MKKLLWLILSVSLCLSMVFGLVACGGDPDPSLEPPTEGLEYTLNEEGTGYILSGEGTARDINLSALDRVIVASTYEGKPVVGVKDNAFNGNDKLKYIYLPPSVTEIGEAAFKSCDELHTVKFAGIKKIVESAFEECRALTTIDLTSVEEIGDSAFYNCSSLTSVVSLDSLTTLGNNVFLLSSLTDDTPDDHITYVGKWAVIYTEYYNDSEGIYSYAPLVFKEGTEYIAMLGGPDGQNVHTDVTLPSTIKSMPYIFMRADDPNSTLRVPNIETLARIEFVGVLENESRGQYDIYVNGEKLENLVIPSNITEIKPYTFKGANLKSITIPASVKTVGAQAFAYCDEVTEVTVGGETEFGDRVFIASGTTKATFASLTSYLNCVFEAQYSSPGYSNYGTTEIYVGNKLLGSENIVIPEGIKNIPNFAFYNLNPSNTYRVTLPNSLETIGTNAFYKNTQARISQLPATLKSIGGAAFAESDVRIGEDFIVPDSVTEIGASAFCDTNCDAIYIGNGVTVINSSTFARCGASKIVIGTSVTDIHPRSFADCENLTELAFNSARAFPWYDSLTQKAGIFGGSDNIEKLVIPYQMLDMLDQFGLKELEIINIGTNFAADSFVNLTTTLEKLTIDVSRLETVEEGAFDYLECQNLYLTGFDNWLTVELPSPDESLLYRARNLYIDGELVDSLYVSGSSTIMPYTLWRINSFGVSSIKNIYIASNVTDIRANSIGSLNDIDIYFANKRADIDLNPNFEGSYSENHTLHFDNTGVFGENTSFKWYINGSDEIVIYDYTGEGMDRDYELVVPAAIGGKAVALVKADTLGGHDVIQSVKFLSNDTVVEDGFYDGKILTGFEGTPSQLADADKSHLMILTLYNDGTDATAMFKDVTTLRAASLKGYTVIPASMFEGCTNLESFVGQDEAGKITEIGARAFMNTNVARFNTQSELTSLTKVGEYAFAGNTNLVVIYIGADVEVGASAFADIETLLNVTCSANILRGYIDFSNVKYITVIGGDTIPADAFAAAPLLERVTIATAIKTVGDNAFKNCSALTEVNLPTSVTAIGRGAFAGVNLKSIYIPAGVTSIGEGAFDSSKTLILCASTTEYSSSWNWNKNHAPVIFGCDGIYRTNGDYLYYEGVRNGDPAVVIAGLTDEAKAKTTLTIPATIDEKSVLYITGDAFSGTLAVTTLYVEDNDNLNPNNLTTSTFAGLTDEVSVYAGSTMFRYLPFGDVAVWYVTGEDASAYSTAAKNVKKIIVTDSVRTISENAFTNINGLEEIYIPETVTSIYGKLFYTTPQTLKKITMPINNYNKDMSRYLPTGAGAIIETFGFVTGQFDEEVFANFDASGVKYIELGKNMSQLIATGFANCPNLVGVRVDPENVKFASIGNALLYKGNDGSLGFLYSSDGIIPEGVTYISGSALVPNSVTEIVIPEGVTKIDNYAFGDHPAVTKITLPSTITSVGMYAFYGENRTLNTLVLNGTTTLGTQFRLDLLPWVGTVEFGGTSIAEGVLYDTANKNQYERHGRYRYVSNIVIHDSVKTIGNNAFYQCVGINSVRFGSGIESISGAFSTCTSLATVDLSACTNLTTIGSYAFGGCPITSLALPNSVTSIGQYAFNGNKLETLTIPAGVTSIGANAFKSGTDNLLTRFNFEGTSADWDKVSLTGPFISVAVDWYFNGTKVTAYTASGDTVAPYLFANCASLESVTIAGATTVGDYAFQGAKITELDLTGVVTIGQYAFAGCTELTSAILPEGVESIGNWAFGQCTSITKVTIPSTVKTFSGSPFAQCTEIDELVWKPVAASLSGSSYYAGLNNATKITVANCSLNDNSVYRVINCSYLFANAIEVTVTGDSNNGMVWYALQNKTTIEKLTLDENITEIKSDAFIGLKNLKELTIMNKDITIKNGCSAFEANFRAPSTYPGPTIDSSFILKVPAGSAALNYTSSNKTVFANATVQYI